MHTCASNWDVLELATLWYEFLEPTRRVIKGCLSSSNYFIDMSPMLMSPFFCQKTCFFNLKTCFVNKKNGLINVGLMSIKWLNKERQPLVLIFYLDCLKLFKIIH